MARWTMLFVNVMYIIIFTLFFIMPFIDFHLWLSGIIFGWIFHWLVGSIIIHRYITHRTFKVNKFWHNTFTIISTLAYAGSSLAWASMHRIHHTTSDTDKDPHSPEKYTWLELLALNVDLKNRQLELFNCKDLLVDKLHLFCHKYYVPINITFIVLLALINVNILIAFWIGIAYHVIGIFFSTWVYHKKLPFQYKNHNLKDNSYNNLFTTLLFHGEAYHNNHHKNPGATSSAEKWYEFDLNNIIIKLIKSK
jgi:stearoyl-CoA desaturase (delta-9 desaturase)